MTNMRLFGIMALVVVAIWFFFIRQGNDVQAQEGYFFVGQTIQIPLPDEPSKTFSLTVIDVTDYGEFSFVDPDNDVFTCTGVIARHSCSSAGITCPPGIRALAKLPKFKDNLMLACMSWADLRD